MTGGRTGGRAGGAAYRAEGLRWRVGPGFVLEVPALELPRGRTTLLLGPSASGKSTLLRLLGRVEGGYFPAEEPAPLEGALWLQARSGDEPLELLGMSERELLGRRVRGATVGLVFQREGLFVGRGALDNVAWPLRALGVPWGEAEARARALLEEVGLAPERAVATLSGGERKRLALARALGPRPAVLLLDEPFTGLDPRALGVLRELVARLVEERGRAGEEMTVVMVTHQPEDIERFGEHVVLMEAGRVVAAGERGAPRVAAGLRAYLEGRGLGEAAGEVAVEEGEA